MKKFLIFAAVLLFVLLSCDDSIPNNPSDKLFGNFWAVDFSTDIEINYRVDASRLYTGEHCTIWAENGSGITAANAKTVADEYDNKIYQKMIDAFSSSVEFNENNFSDTMEFADWLGDDDDKLCILLLDIKDNYNKGVNNSYIAGYFYSRDLLDLAYSNNRDMIYIDTYPALDPSNLEYTYRTFAHEMQHLMNFATSIAERSKVSNGIRNIYNMDIWIDEGLSSAAEYIYSGSHSKDRLGWFNNNGMVNDNGLKTSSGLINRGNNFFVWGNRVPTKNKAPNENESIYANQDDYATVYLFFQWLRLQGSADILKKIITSEYFDHNAVVSNIDDYSTWDSLLETWLAANRIKSNSGRYGYKGVTELDIKVTYAPTGKTSVILYPGEGVYSLANTQPSTIPDTDIEYKYLTNSAVSSSFLTGSTLLTYNKNIKNSKNEPSADGSVTGVAPAASVSVGKSNESRSVVTDAPLRIDAGDLLRRFDAGHRGAQSFVYESSKDGNSGE